MKLFTTACATIVLVGLTKTVEAVPAPQGYTLPTFTVRPDPTITITLPTFTVRPDTTITTTFHTITIRPTRSP